jgi:hypothetical protein
MKINDAPSSRILEVLKNSSCLKCKVEKRKRETTKDGGPEGLSTSERGGRSRRPGDALALGVEGDVHDAAEIYYASSVCVKD